MSYKSFGDYTEIAADSSPKMIAEFQQAAYEEMETFLRENKLHGRVSAMRTIIKKTPKKITIGWVVDLKQSEEDKNVTNTLEKA